MMLQLWMNTIVNIRINRSYVSQLGLFKIRRGAGITPQMISRLPANGAIVVNSQDDIEQFVMQEASAASFNDESNIQSWAERVTSAFESVTGESLPSETSATASALQTHSAQSQFVLIKESVGLFLQRWLERHAMPTIFKNIKPGDVIAMAMEDEEIFAWDESLVNTLLYDEVSRVLAAGALINPDDVENEKQRLLSSLKNKGTQRFAKVISDIEFIEYQVAIDITNESVDKGVIAQNLLQALTAAPEYRDSILPQLFDAMGLTFVKPKTQPQPIQQNGQPAGGGAQPTPQSPQTQSPVLALGRANTLATQGQPGG